MFINDAVPMEVKLVTKEEGGLMRQYIPAKLNDNPTLNDNDPDYISRLEGLGSPELVKAMRDGDWNIVAGGALDDLWNTSVLQLPRFPVPTGWRLDRSLDWGSAAPFSVGWWAEADGTEAKLPTGRVFCPPKGTLIRIAEWYGTKKVGSNVGLKLSAKEVAKGILERETVLRKQAWINTTVYPGPADNSIGDDESATDSDSIERIMVKEGVRWTESDKSPGSRVIGLQLLRDRLSASLKREGKGIYYMENCVSSAATLPVLPRDPNNIEDVDSDAEDHQYDEWRYRCLHDPQRLTTKLKVKNWS
jgi:hypothetical protein